MNGVAPSFKCNVTFPGKFPILSNWFGYLSCRSSTELIGLTDVGLSIRTAVLTAQCMVTSPIAFDNANPLIAGPFTSVTNLG